MKILIGGPVRQELDIFTEYIKSVRALELPDGYTAECHFIFNECDLSHLLLPNETYEIINTGSEYSCNEKEHVWSKSNYDHMSFLRNHMLDHALTGDYDYYFLADSDLILHPETLRHLLSLNKDLVGELFWTEYVPGGGDFWINAWEYDQCYSERESIRKWIYEPGIYPCGGTGACFLISKKVIKAGVNYTPIHNLRCLYGEDRWFCIRAVVNGFDIFVDNQCRPLHLYRRSVFEQYKNGKLNVPH